MRIRPYGPADLPALYRICLATGDGGRDASAHYRDPLLVGHVFAAPYAIFEPQSAFVLEDEEGVGGYIVGAADTAPFEDTLEAQWWPELRRLYPDALRRENETLSFDRLMMRYIRHTPRTPAHICKSYPSHLHINLLPRLQGRGSGKRLMDRWLAAMRAAESKGAHLGVGAANERAVAFYRAHGFHEIERFGSGNTVIFFGIAL